MGQWKLSLFNTFRYQDGYHYCFNSRSSALFSLSPRQYCLFEKCLREIDREGYSAFSAFQDVLIQNAFIVPRDIDEYEQEHRLFLNTRDNIDWAFLAVVPTLACNMKCSYCFQKDITQKAPMNQRTCQGVVDMVSQLARKVKGIAVLWFGGEPFLALKTIENLSGEFQDICRKQGIRYHAEMITNGSLLDQETLSRLKKLNLERMEISLDGLPGSYSMRKGAPLKKALKFYDFLMNSAASLLEAVGSLKLHLNVDRDNVEEAKEIVLQMKRKSSAVSKIDFHLQPLSTGKGLIECIPHDCYSHREAGNVELDFKKFLASEGLKVNGFPSRLNHPCQAIKKYGYTIDPAGNIGKCVPATGRIDSTFYTITPQDTSGTLRELESRPQPYADFDPFESKTCRGCPFLPICLGQCPKSHETVDFVCTRKQKFEDELAFYDGIDRSLFYAGH
jgi:uncharacterized protein